MRLRRLLVLVLLAALAAAPAARADGDPASDFLVFSNYYTPYHPAPDKAVTDAFGALLKSAKQRGYPIRVAVIGSKDDLGSVPQLYGHPQVYARFLSQELAYAYKGRLLIVMPQGFGVHRIPPREARAIKGLAISDPSSAGLVRSAERAVHRLAAAGGHPLPAVAVAAAPATSSGGSSSNVLAIVVVAVGAALILVAGGLALWRWRRGSVGGEAGEDRGAPA